MLVGYVSDEQHVALSDVQVEFRQNGASQAVVESTPSGSIHATLDPGEYEVILNKSGHGSKRTTVAISSDHSPIRFRLLSDHLLGYAWPLWVKSGNQTRYYVHASEEVRVTLWRYGDTKERVAILDWHGEHAPRAGTQTLPDGDFTQTGVDWSSKQPATPDGQHAEQITAPDESGLYYFHLDGKTSDAFFSFPLVVAPSTPRSDLAVVASTMTWNAYNNFGGRSNYVNIVSLPQQPTVDPHQDISRYSSDVDLHGYENHEYRPLSFERPAPLNHVRDGEEYTDPIEGRNETTGAAAEWRMLGWLETAGYNYDLYAENQLHDGSVPLDDYRALLIHTHPEYWSYEMYRRVRDWVYERGGHLLYLGGNGIDCEVEVIDEARMRYLNLDDGVEREKNHVDVTADAFESRFHLSTGESGGELLGEVLSDTGIMTAAPYEVLDGSHWVFNGTDLQNGDTFGEANLQERCHGGASGHETDKLSWFAHEETRLLAKGTNPDDGGAEMLYYETDSGGAVFSVGSITYPASLPVDDDISTITANVIDEMTG